ncbi:MAG: hypothetical protein LBS20_06090 [Prevotella sp.]|jgi:predicted metal-dependent hydrolase|nr:hypothetical protein [Prevotella sp.]
MNSVQSQINSLRQSLVEQLSNIPIFPEGLLPHTVFIEEESDAGYTVYNRYELLSISPDGSCTARNPDSGEITSLHLSEINIDWLATVWNRYRELSAIYRASRLEHAMKLILDVALLEIPCFEQSRTYSACVEALEDCGKRQTENKRELCVFLYPSERFERNATDAEIIFDWENDEGQYPSTGKYTPDEFAAMLNDEEFINRNMYVRFIAY